MNNYERIKYTKQLGGLIKKIPRSGKLSKWIAVKIINSNMPYKEGLALAALGTPYNDNNRFCRVKRNGIIIDLDLSQELHQFIFLDIFEKKVIETSMSYLKAKGVFIDVGANIGYWSLIAGNKEAKVFAFEPSKVMSSYIKRQIKNNPGLENYIEINTLGVSSTKKTAELVFPNNNDKYGQASLYNKEGEREYIKLDTLDSLLGDIREIDLIKIDVEGHEKEVLIGAENIFTNIKPKMVVVEIIGEALLKAGTSAKEISDILRNYGYSPKYWFPISLGLEKKLPAENYFDGKESDTLAGNALWILN